MLIKWRIITFHWDLYQGWAAWAAGTRWATAHCVNSIHIHVTWNYKGLVWSHGVTVSHCTDRKNRYPHLLDEYKCKSTHKHKFLLRLFVFFTHQSLSNLPLNTPSVVPRPYRSFSFFFFFSKMESHDHETDASLRCNGTYSFRWRLSK